MKHLRISGLLLLVPALLMAQQESHHPGGPPVSLSSPRFELPPGTEEVSIPFRLVNQHIVLPVMVNGQGPFQLTLDTGMPAQEIGLHDSGKLEPLHLAYRDDVRMKVGGAGGKGKAQPARVATGVSCEMGGLKLLDAGAIILPPIPGFAAYSDGVIGAVLFRHFTVTVDNDRGVVTLRRPESYQPPDDATVLPLKEDHPAPLIEAKVRIGEGETVPVSLVVDLGATHAVSLNENDRGIAAPASSLAARIGRGLSGPLTGKVGRIRALELGNLTLKDVVATFPDKEYQSPRGMDSRDGNLGNGALNRFNVTFDYAGGRMVLQPAKRFNEPFEWDMSGMQAEPDPEGSVKVITVLAGSPAAEAGIKKNDVVARIGGVKVDAGSYYELREKLRKNGDTVAVELQRGGKPIEVSLKLRRLI
jgi:hypothetical protein